MAVTTAAYSVKMTAASDHLDASPATSNIHVKGFLFSAAGTAGDFILQIGTADGGAVVMEANLAINSSIYIPYHGPVPGGLFLKALPAAGFVIVVLE